VHSPEVEKLYTKFIQLTNPGDRARIRIDALRSTEIAVRQIVPGAPELPAGERLLSPMGADRRIEPFPRGIQILSGFYFTLPAIIPPAIVEERISELRAHPDWSLVLPLTPGCVVDPKGLHDAVARQFWVRFAPAAKRGLTVAKPFCDYVLAQYDPGIYKSPVPGYKVWTPKQSRQRNPPGKQ
jgi:hypothetical protein